jgi:hypothetical protein
MRAALAGIAILGVVIGGSYLYTKATESTIVTTITKTDRECKADSNGATTCRYMIYTPDEVFENVDTWWYLKFDSSDFNNKLSGGIGKSYKLTVYGFRIPFFSQYRNVVDYEPAEVTQ